MTDLAARGRLRVSGEGDTLVLSLEGPLDSDSGALLLSAVTSTRGGGPSHIEIDLGGVTSYTREGTAALVGCREVVGLLASRLSYRAESPMARSLLLETLRDAD